MPVERYLYRCTTDKLTMHIARIEEAGDRVEWPEFTGGRDWILVCRKADTSSPDERTSAIVEAINTAVADGLRMAGR